MRVFLDTNVLVSAFASTGTCAEILAHSVGRHDICVSRQVLDELRRALARKLGLSRADVDLAVSFLEGIAETHSPVKLGKPVCRDPDDDGVLGAAVAARADCILTGDGDLLAVGSFRGIPIVSPSVFWKLDPSFGVETDR